MDTLKLSNVWMKLTEGAVNMGRVQDLTFP